MRTQQEEYTDHKVNVAECNNLETHQLRAISEWRSPITTPHRKDTEEGYCAVIASGVDEAKATLEWYLGVTDHEPPSVLKTKLICQAHNSGGKRKRPKK